MFMTMESQSDLVRVIFEKKKHIGIMQCRKNYYSPIFYGKSLISTMSCIWLLAVRTIYMLFFAVYNTLCCTSLYIKSIMFKTINTQKQSYIIIIP